MLAEGDRLHLGCGLNTPEGWLNLDGSWNARLAKRPTVRKLLGRRRFVPEELLNTPWNPDVFVHDVRKPMPFDDGTFSAVYASHLLEHLYQDEARRLLAECFRILRHGGVIRIVVPDLQAIVRTYLSSAETGADGTPRADRLNEQLSMRSPRAQQGNILYRIYSCLVDFHSHKWLYDVESLVFYLRQTGFVDASERECHQSRIEDIEQIELADRILDGAGVCVEAVKPALEAGGM